MAVVHRGRDRSNQERFETLKPDTSDKSCLGKEMFNVIQLMIRDQLDKENVKPLLRVHFKQVSIF